MTPPYSTCLPIQLSKKHRTASRRASTCVSKHRPEDSCLYLEQWCKQNRSILTAALQFVCINQDYEIFNSIKVWTNSKKYRGFVVSVSLRNPNKRQHITRRAVFMSGKTEARSRNHSCRGKAISIKYHECVCLLAYFLGRIILSSVACQALTNFSTLSH
jgi:hypothetical protein